MRKCKQCGVEQPITDFANAGIVKGKKYYKHKCIKCSNWAGRERMWELQGILEANHMLFTKLLKTQNYQCAICFKSLDTNGVLDHDHKTGLARGVLCNQCNAGLGMFKDSKLLLTSALKYLKETTHA